MALLKIYQGKSKAKKKPGWQKAEQEQAEWLARLNAQTLFNPGAKPKMQRAVKAIDPIVRGPVIDETRLAKLPSLETPGGAGTKAVARPEKQYRDSPEMLKRELIARERKFAIAPAYNKGAAMLVTEDLMADIKAGATRRRA